MPDEKITYKTVKDGVDRIRECANTMEEIFNNTTSEMRKMTTTDSFQGEASDTLQNVFEEFKGSFPDYIEQVREFADAYEAASQLLLTRENEMKNKAQQL